MWPFRRHASPDDIDLSNLAALEDRDPTRKYVNLLMIDLVDRGVVEHTLRESEPLPLPQSQRLRGCSVELPDFSRAFNRLKVISGLDPVKYPQPKAGKTSIGVAGMIVDVHMLFDDTGVDRTVHLRFEEVGTY